ncbi:hypothetical protein [uncultured Dokdonia sp.]|nr:hypothetical protein [uncultured Dokdonia sp.]
MKEFIIKGGRKLRTVKGHALKLTDTGLLVIDDAGYVLTVFPKDYVG